MEKPFRPPAKGGIGLAKNSDYLLNPNGALSDRTFANGRSAERRQTDRVPKPKAEPSGAERMARQSGDALTVVHSCAHSSIVVFSILRMLWPMMHLPAAALTSCVNSTAQSHAVRRGRSCTLRARRVRKPRRMGSWRAFTSTSSACVAY